MFHNVSVAESRHTTEDDSHREDGREWKHSDVVDSREGVLMPEYRISIQRMSDGQQTTAIFRVPEEGDPNGDGKLRFEGGEEVAEDVREEFETAKDRSYYQPIRTPESKKYWGYVVAVIAGMGFGQAPRHIVEVESYPEIEPPKIPKGAIP